MADYHSLVKNCIEYVQDKVQGRHGAPQIQLHKRQCEYVAQELLTLSQFLDDRGAHDFGPGIGRTVLLHLHSTVKRAEMFVKKCCCEDSSWLATGVMMGDTKEEVIAILLDLHQWKSALDVAICALAGGSQSAQLRLWETGEEGYQRLWKKHSKMRIAIQDASTLDQKELLEKITISVAEEDRHGDDYIRGLFLRSWLNPIEGDLQSVEDQLKAYTISRDLGSGASGMVLQVKWLGQELALKILKGIDRTEATVLGQLQHPNIVRLLHYWEDLNEDCPRSCIIMELMPKDLQKHIGNVLRKQSDIPVKSKKGVAGGMPFSLPVAIDTMLQVAQAMRELHELKLTHRDLKTSNILVKPVNEECLELHSQGYLEVKLADFGSAKAYANTSQTGDLTRNTGTTVYGAPEIFEKEKILRERNFPRKADVWSFGMTCSEILTGKVPFAAESRPTLHKGIIKNGLRPNLPEDCPEYLRFCIRRCWELQPQKRPSFSDLCRMLRHAKLLSLGLLDVVDETCLFAYQTSTYVLKSGIHSLRPQEEAKMSRFKLDTLWHNLRGEGGNSKSRQPPASEAMGSAKSWEPPKGDLLDYLEQPVQFLKGVLSLRYTRRIRQNHRLQVQIKQRFAEFDIMPTFFTFNELRVATRDFHVDMRLGEGGFGVVYKGVLKAGNLVAVKQLFNVGTTQAGIDDLCNEVVLIAGMKHRNLVHLKGCCIQKGLWFLVYEYVDNYDVYHNLLGSTRQVVSWPVRLKICVGVACGLHYLHELVDPRVIHRDIKAKNILLDKNMKPKIADFGLAILFPDDTSHITVHTVAGTNGYFAPEYATTGQLSDKVDVFSFGILCLEIISGRCNMDISKPVEQVCLLQWAWHLHKEDRLLELIDPTLSLTPQEIRDVTQLIHVLLSCVVYDPHKRPTMAQIVGMLQGNVEFKLPEADGGYVENKPGNVVGNPGMTGVMAMTGTAGSTLERSLSHDLCYLM